MRDIALRYFDEYTPLNRTGMKCDPLDVEDFMVDVLAAPKGIAFAVYEGDVAYGGILGVIRPWEFNTQIQVLKELGWFVLPEYKDRHPFAAALLYRTLLKWAKSEGATAAAFATTDRDNAGETARLYEAHGLVKMDTHYMGVI
ncbi:MAG: GNAT family N-acetyltransferase, partial [Smithella sp.]|jgi:hypothetical protein